MQSEPRSIEVLDAIPSYGIEEDELHRLLSRFARVRLSPALLHASRRQRLDEERRLLLLEEGFLEGERHAVSAWAAQAPDHNGKAFACWFDALLEEGPGQHDALFPWLAETASLADMRWFLTQEVAGEAGFDDLAALTQVKLPERPKLELARNYWDEMGQGHAGAMHGALLHHMASTLHLDPANDVVVWEAIALGNLMAGLALDRCYAFHSVGCLGAVELTAPGRAEAVSRGLERLGVDGRARRYYAVHATLDKKHYAAWRDEVLVPLVDEDPRRALPIAEGALMRLLAGARCFERYRRELGVAT